MKGTKRILSGVLSVLTTVTFAFSVTGCDLESFFNDKSQTKTGVNSGMADGNLTNGEWLAMVNDAFGMRHEENAGQSDVEIAKDWGVIGEEEINLDSPVDDKFATQTLMRATGYCDLNSTDTEIINSAIDHGVITDSSSISSPQAAVSALNKAVDSWSDQQFENRNNIVYAENVKDFTESLSYESVVVSADNSQVTLPSDSASEVKEGTVLLVPTDDNGGASALKVVSVSETGTGTSSFVTVPATIQELYTTLEVSGSFEPDYNNIEILDDSVTISGGEIMGMSDTDSSAEVQPLSSTGFDGSKIIQTFDPNSSILIEKDLGDGVKLTAKVKDININTDIDWDFSLSDGLEIDHVYLAVDSDISTGVKCELFEKKLKEKYKQLKRNDVSEGAECNIDVAKIPIKICPGVTLEAKIGFLISAKGFFTVEVSFFNSKGIEIKNGSVRKIDEQRIGDLEFKLTAEIGAYAHLKVSLNLDYIIGNCKVVALDFKIGPKAKGVLKSDMTGEDDDLVCVDVSGYLAINLNVELNDLFKIIGLKATIKLIDVTEKNSPIVFTPLHLEIDGRSDSVKVQIVPKCTKGGEAKETTQNSENENVTESVEESIETATIAEGDLQINKFYLSISENETAQVVVMALPAGITMADTIWSSSDPSVATVDANGIVTATGTGSTIITVELDDGSAAMCAVNVYEAPKNTEITTLTESIISKSEKQIMICA